MVGPDALVPLIADRVAGYRYLKPVIGLIVIDTSHLPDERQFEEKPPPPEFLLGMGQCPSPCHLLCLGQVLVVATTNLFDAGAEVGFKLLV